MLTLPPGVSAIPVDGLAGRKLLGLNGAKAGTVNCPGGNGTVTCSSGVGLAPNETVTLLFRLVAGDNAMNGRITGIVSAGTNVNVSVNVQMNVQPAPVTDGVMLKAKSSWSGLLLWVHPIVDVTVTNTGTSSLPVTLTVDQPAKVVTSTQKMTCTVDGGTTCLTAAELAPGEKLEVTLQLSPDPWPVRSPNRNQVHLSATLGVASDSKKVTIWDCTCPTGPTGPTTPPGEPSTPPSTPPSTTTPPSGTSTKPSEPTQSSPPVTTTTTPGTKPSTGQETEDPGRVEQPPPTTTEPPTTSEPPSGGLGGLLGWLLGI
jgi:hypothetical protein